MPRPRPLRVLVTAKKKCRNGYIKDSYMIVESKSLCSNSKVMAKAPKLVLRIRIKGAIESLASSSSTGMGARGIGVEGSGLGSVTHRVGSRTSYMQAEKRAKRAKNRKCIVYLCLCVCLPTVKRGKNGKLQKTRHTVVTKMEMPGKCNSAEIKE